MLPLEVTAYFLGFAYPILKNIQCQFGIFDRLRTYALLRFNAYRVVKSRDIPSLSLPKLKKIPILKLSFLPIFFLTLLKPPYLIVHKNFIVLARMVSTMEKNPVGDDF